MMPNDAVPEILRGCALRETAHYNGGRDWFGYDHECIEYPRLRRHDRYDRRSKSVSSKWFVDEAECIDIHDAAKRLQIKPVLPDELLPALALVTDEPQDFRKTEHLSAILRLRRYGMVHANKGRVTITELGREYKPKETDNDA